MQKKHLKSVLQTIEENPHPVAVVFDLDSTLFCVKWRTEGIIKDAVQTPAFIKNFSEMTEQFQQIQVHPKDWSLKDIFKRHGLDPNTPASKTIQKFWSKYFFQNDYLHLDRPYEGSVEYVNLLHKTGGHVFYLTGRNKPYMGKGTVRSLKKWNFPLETENHLILKKDPAFEDSVYKLEELKMLKNKFQTILFFENEPVILHMVHKYLPDIKMFWIDSAHSGKKSGPPDHIPAIPMSYLL
ncbi:MAG: HAD family hydrolase [Bdellovibrionales bacterium]|nr:HAD family hydrolase [Bdellovibrionales bacterium]